MRRFLKFLHTVGAAGLMGGVAALAVMLVLAPASIGTPGYFPVVAAMAKISAWIIGPSLIVTIMSGLAAIGLTPAFHDAGWAWVKAATGILLLEGGLHVLGPIQEEAKRGAGALGGGADTAGALSLLQSEANTMWLLLAVSVVNVALGIWRPRLPKYKV